MSIKRELFLEGRLYNYKNLFMQTNAKQFLSNKEQQLMTAPIKSLYHQRTSKTDMRHEVGSGEWSKQAFDSILALMEQSIYSRFWSQPKFRLTCDSHAHYNPVPDSVTRFKRENLFHFPVNASVYLLLQLHNRGSLCVSSASLLLVFFCGRSFLQPSHICTSIIVRTLGDQIISSPGSYHSGIPENSPYPNLLTYTLF